jgi:5-methylcytosine-specific restriction protein A
MQKLQTLRNKLAPSRQALVRVPPKQADSFYTSPPWRMLCEDIKRERWPLLLRTKGHCCEDATCTAQHSATTRIYFDHVRERRDCPALALVKSNVMGRCGKSHSLKTAQARRQRYQGATPAP